MIFSLKKNFFLIHFFALLFFFFSSPLYSDITPPEPSELTRNWWNYFAGQENTSRIAPFLEELKKQTATLSEGNKEQAQELIAKMSVHFEEYKQALTKTPITDPVQPLIKDRYTIPELIELWKQQQAQLSTLKTRNSQISIIDLQRKNIEEELVADQNSYQKSSSHSESQFLAGLALINSQVLLETNTLLQKRALEQKESTQKELTFLSEEIETAKQRLFPTNKPIFDYYKQIDQAEQNLRIATERIAQKRIEKAKIPTSSLTEEQELEFSSIEIEKALLNLRYIQDEYMLYLERALKNELIPKQQTTSFFREVEKLQSSLSLKINEWSAQANNAIQMASSQIPNGNSEAIRSLAKENLLKIEDIKNENLALSFLEKTYQSFDSFQTESFLNRLSKAGEVFHYAWSRIALYSQKKLFQIGNNPVTFINIVYFIAILLGTFWLSRLFLTTLSQIAVSRKGVKRSLVYSITRLIHYLFLGIGIVIALSALGFDFSNLVLLASALGIGLGFGLQSIFNNFISGIILLFENHLKVGDYIELDSGLRGEIREINVRSTIITDNDGIDILIPNAEIVSQRVLNWTMKVPYRRYHIPFKVSYGTDKELVAKTIKEAALGVSYTLVKIGIPEPAVRMTKLGDSGMEFELVVWVNEKYTKRGKKVLSDYLWAIETALVKEGISIPFPKYDINLADEKKPQKNRQKKSNKP